MEFAKQTENGYEQFTTCTEGKLKAYLSLGRSCKLLVSGKKHKKHLKGPVQGNSNVLRGLCR
jgi:hypothetical protein